MDPTLMKLAMKVEGTPKCQAVCRLYTGKGDKWTYTDKWGGLFLVEDKSINFLQLLDTDSASIIWECELYPDAQLEKLDDHFLALEGEDTIFGLCFATGHDVKLFKTTAEKQVSTKKATPKKGGKKSGGGGFFSSIKRGLQNVQNAFAGKDENEKKRNEVQISRATNFTRSMYIGFEPGKGFVYENLPEEWKTFFAGAGISKEQLSDEKTAKTIFKTMQKYQKRQGGDGPSRPKAPPPPVPPSRTGGESSSGAPAPPPPPPPPPSLNNMAKKMDLPTPQSGRANLMEEIRKGTQLKKVEAQEKKEIDLDIQQMSTAGKNDLMSMLKQSLAKRRDDISSSSSEEGSSTDEDW